MTVLSGFDGLSVVEDLCFTRIEGCKTQGKNPDGSWPRGKCRLKDKIRKSLNSKRRAIAKRPAKGVRAGDFSKLERLSKALGSNPGGLFRDPATGQKWYVKQQRSQEHASNEALASALYRETGIRTPEIVRGTGTPGLDGPQTASVWSDDIEPGGSDMTEEQDRKFQKGFAVDAWLANWDVAGARLDNIGVDDTKTGDDEVARLDLGGAMLYRARGGPKGANFGDTVGEWETMRNRNLNEAGQLFRTMTPQQLAESAKLVEKVTPERIRQLVAEYDMPGSLADTLIARREDIITKARKAAAG